MGLPESVHVHLNCVMASTSLSLNLASALAKSRLVSRLVVCAGGQQLIREAGFSVYVAEEFPMHRKVINLILSRKVDYPLPFVSLVSTQVGLVFNN